MCPGRTSQVVGKAHSAEERVEWARGGGKSNQYWSAIGPVLVIDSDHYYFARRPVVVGSLTSTAYFSLWARITHRGGMKDRKLVGKSGLGDLTPGGALVVDLVEAMAQDLVLREL